MQLRMTILLLILYVTTVIEELLFVELERLSAGTILKSDNQRKINSLLTCIK